MATGDQDAGFVLACILMEMAVAYSTALPKSAMSKISFIAKELSGLTKPRVEIEQRE